MTQEKGAVIQQETDPALPGSVQESPAEVWVGGSECSSTDMEPFEVVHNYLHYLRHSLASGKWQEHSSTHKQKIGLKI